LIVKKIILLTVVLSIVVSSALASLTVVVKRPEDPTWQEWEDSKLWIAPSDILLVGVLDLFGEAAPGSTLAVGILSGSVGSFEGSGVGTMSGVTATVTDDAALAGALGIENMFVSLTIVDPLGPGLLAGDMEIHCEGEGDITLVAINPDTYLVEDVQIVHQTPEPATLALLSMGAALAFVRKR
jgi:hypothetical protein